MSAPKYNQGTVFFAIIFLAGSVFWAIQRLSTPLPVYADAKIQDFSAKRSMTHLEKIAVKPHPIGSAQNDSVAAYLMQEAKKLGAEVRIQDTTVQLADNKFARVKNLIFLKKGTLGDGGKAVLVAGHYDSVIFGPGAADDGSACAAVLECLRAMKIAGEIFRNDIIFLLTDGEELGLMGAKAWLEHDKDAKRIGIVLNFEARGAGGQPLFFESCGEHLPLLQAVNEAIPNLRGSSLFEEVYKKMPNGTDFIHFKEKIPYGMNFAFIEKHTHYHTELDSPENIDLGTMQVQGDIMLNLTRFFAKKDLDNLPPGKQVYFDYPFLGLVHYTHTSALTAAVVLGIAGILLLILLIVKKQINFLKFFAALFTFLLMTAASAGAVYGIWQMIYNSHQAYHWTNYGDIYYSDAYFWSFTAFTIGLNLFVTSLLARKLGAANLQGATAFLLTALNLFVTAEFPGASYITFLLASAAILSGFYTSLRDNFSNPFALDSWIVGGIFLAIAPVILPMIYLLKTALTVHFSYGVAGVTAISFFALYGFFHLFHQNHSRTFCYMLLTISLLTWLFFSANAKFDEEHRKNNSLFAVYDADKNIGKWASFDKKTDEFTQNYLGEAPLPDSLSNFHQFIKAEFLTNTDSTLKAKGAEAKLISVKKDSLTKRIVFDVQSGENAELCVLKFSPQLKNIQISHETGEIKLADTLSDVILFAVPKLTLSFDISAENNSCAFEVQEMKYGLESVLNEAHQRRQVHMMPKPRFGNHALWIKKSFAFELKEEEKMPENKAEKSKAKLPVKKSAPKNGKPKKTK